MSTLSVNVKYYHKIIKIIILIVKIKKMFFKGYNKEFRKK